MPGLRVCRICGKPLGIRRSNQGIRVHSGCRISLGRSSVDQVAEQTHAVLQRLGQVELDSEVSPLLREASVTARELLQNLQKLKGYVAPHR
jgi:hypothetical protein